MVLTELEIKKAVPSLEDKQVKISDGAGLYILIHPNGSKYWRMAYRFEGKQKTLSFGIYPEVSLTDAREKCQAARKLLKEGIDPSGSKRAPADNFDDIAKELYKVKSPTWTKGYATQWIGNLEKYAAPFIGNKAVTEIEPMEIVGIMRVLEDKSNFETRDRLLRDINAVFKYAIATGRAKYNPAEIRMALAERPKTEHFACMRADELPHFLNALSGYNKSTPAAMTAFKLLMLTATRTSEVRYAKWADIDLDAACWTISEEQTGRKGKNGKRKEHAVPLSTQAVKLLQDLPRTGEYVFPNRDDAAKVISENTILGIIEAIGYKGKMTGHGFRSLARSILGDMGHRWEVLEAMLSHSLTNQTAAATVRTTYFEERRGVMQQWADYLDTVEAIDATAFQNTPSYEEISDDSGMNKNVTEDALNLADLLAASNQDIDPIGSGFEYLLRDIATKDAPSAALMKAIISNPGIIHLRLPRSRTFLHHAAGYGKIKTTKYLVLYKNADINSQDVHGQTPLDYAIAANRTEVAAYLQKNGALTKHQLSIQPPPPLCGDASVDSAKVPPVGDIPLVTDKPALSIGHVEERSIDPAINMADIVRTAIDFIRQQPELFAAEIAELRAFLGEASILPIMAPVDVELLSKPDSGCAITDFHIPPAPVILFEQPLDRESSHSTPAYQIAFLTLQLSSTVAMADGDFCDVEKTYLQEQILSWSHLTPDHQQQLLAQLELLKSAPASLANLRKKLGQLDVSARESIAAFMATVAQADGVVLPAEVKILEKIYQALGVDPNKVFSDLHVFATEGKPSLAAVKKIEETGFTLDPERIIALQRDTEKVTALLAGIFKEDEPIVLPVPEPETDIPAAEEFHSILELDEAHALLVRELLSRPQWCREELLAMAAKLELMLDGALELINEASFDIYGFAFAEGDDPFVINPEVLEQIKA